MHLFLLIALAALLGCQPAAPIAYEQAPTGATKKNAKDARLGDGQDKDGRRIGGDDVDTDGIDIGYEKPVVGSGDSTLDPGIIDPGTLPSAARLSHGSGGQTGQVEVNFRASNAQNSSYKINAPSDVSSKVYGLHIHLHGDGGGGYRDFPNRETRLNLIGVTVKAPNQDLTWGRNAGVAHAQYVNDLIQNELFKKYNIDLDRIYFSGVSGGAYFLTGNFIPTFGQNYHSGAFIMCGGEAPRVNFADPTMLTQFRIYFQTTAGERQDITQSVQKSISAYQRALDSAVQSAGLSGFDKKKVLDSEIIGNGGHCEFDGQAYSSGIQFMMDQKFNTVVVR